MPSSRSLLGGGVLSGADRHGAGVDSITPKARPRPRLAGAPFGMDMPSDPRRGTVPRGGASWSEHGDQTRKTPQYLAIRTGPNNASVLSRLMARGTYGTGNAPS
jgi:hypothetical protein